MAATLAPKDLGPKNPTKKLAHVGILFKFKIMLLRFKKNCDCLVKNSFGMKDLWQKTAQLSGTVYNGGA